MNESHIAATNEMLSSPKERLVGLDLETTGLDIKTARIVSIGLWEIGQRPIEILIDPEIPIPKEASAIHDITDSDIIGCLPFKEHAQKLHTLLKGATIVGYNSRKFDIPILREEFKRAGISFEPTQQIDAFLVWKEIEGRKLRDFVSRFCPTEIQFEAHSALSDITGTLTGLAGLQAQKSLSICDMIEITSLNSEDGMLSYSDEVLRFNFGKFKGEPVTEHPNYVAWVLSQDFISESSRAQIIQEMALHES